MTSRYSIRLAAKTPIPADSLPDRRRDRRRSCAARDRPTAAICAAAPVGLHRRGDINPSLSVKDGWSGRPVFNCFAGGDYRDIIDALIARGVWPQWR